MASTTALRLAGRDALALLHRISTNAVADLAPGQARATLFCDFRGRLMHRAVVAATADGAAWLLRDDAPGEALASFLDRHIFRDDVRIEDHSARWFVELERSAAAASERSVQERDGIPAIVRVGPSETLTVGQAPSAADRIDPAERERLRVRVGRPAHGHEIVEAFTPFEVGLAHEVHLDKGCFTGQEVLMRLVTYRSVRRRLVRVGSTGLAPDVPQDLRDQGAPAGVLTSAVQEGEHWIGLAVVRNEVCDAPRALTAMSGIATTPPEPLPLTRPQGRPGP